MLAWCLEALAASGAVTHLVIVAPAGWEGEARRAVPSGLPAAAVVPGGATRARSVARGLAAVPDGVERVLVHDAARPLLRATDVRAVLDGLDGHDGALAAAPLADTLKRVAEDGTVTGTPDRAGLWRAQTPQAFRTGVLRRAVARAEGEGGLDAATDCSALVTAAGGRVAVVALTAENLKVTTPADLALADLVLAARGDAAPAGARARAPQGAEPVG